MYASCVGGSSSRDVKAVDGVAMNEKFEGDNTSTSASVVSHAFHKTAI